MMGIIINMMQDIITRSQAEKQHITKYFDDNVIPILEGEETLEGAIYTQCDKYPECTYYGKHDFVREQLLLALERAKQKQAEEAEEDDDDLSFQW